MTVSCPKAVSSIVDACDVTTVCIGQDNGHWVPHNKPQLPPPVQVFVLAQLASN